MDCAVRRRSIHASRMPELFPASIAAMHISCDCAKCGQHLGWVVDSGEFIPYNKATPSPDGKVCAVRRTLTIVENGLMFHVPRIR